MTNFYGVASATETNIGMPGAAPLGTGLMQGNPQTPPSATPQPNLPGNQNTGAQLTATQLSNGSISANSQPTGVLTAPGTDSLMAQMSRGQLVLGGQQQGFQSSVLSADGGGGPAPGQVAVSPQGVRNASALPYPASQQNFTGN